MPAYNPRGGDNVHIDKVLSNISVGWINEQTDVSSALFPMVSVPKQSDKYYIFGRESWSVDPANDYRAPATEATEIPGMRVSTDQYFCTERALQGTVTPEEIQNADSPLAPRREMAELVTAKVRLARELRTRELVTDPDIYLTSHVETLSGGDRLDDYENSDPFTLFRDMRRTFHATLFTEPNVAVIPWRVMSFLEDHPQIRERVAGVEAQFPQRERVARALGFANIVVPGGGYDSNASSPVHDIGYIWKNEIILAWVPPRPGLKTPAFGYEFVWPLHGGAQTVKRWWNDDREAEVIRVSRHQDHKIVAKDDNGRSMAGMLIQNAIADTGE